MIFFKKLLITLFVIFLISGLLLWILTKIIKPEIVQHYVSGKITQLTHLPSRIDGDINWQLLPQPGVKITHLVIGNANTGQYNLNLKNIMLHLKLTPLFKGKLVFSNIKIDGFSLNIHNAPHVSVPSIPISAHTTSSVDTNQERFAIERLLLSKGQIYWQHEGKKILFSNLQIGVERLASDSFSFPFQLKSTVALSNEKPLLNGKIQFKGNAKLPSAFFNDPLKQWNTVVVDGQFLGSDFVARNMKISQINSHVSLKNKQLKLNPLTFGLYQGESIGNLQFNFQTKKIQINQTASNINVTKIMQDALDINDIEGKLEFSLHAETNLQDTNWQHNMNANGIITIKDGTLKTVDLDKVITFISEQIDAFHIKKINLQKMLSLIQLKDPIFFRGKTPFKVLTLEYHWQNNLLYANSLLLQTSSLQLHGDGNMNLHDQTLNSKITVTIAQGNEKIMQAQKMLGGSFPLLITGTMQAPLVIPDLKKMSTALTPYILKEVLQKPLNGLKDQFNNILNEI